MDAATAIIGELEMDRVIYQRGRMAGEEGTSPRANPYRSPRSRELWAIGHNDGVLAIQDMSLIYEEVT
jgi:ribosome modulation factor